MLFVALTENPPLKTIFKKYDDYMPSFNINEFKFVLIDIKPGYDVFRYVVSCENFNMVFLLIGVDVTRFCDPLSNVDLVHFIWDNYRRFTFKKYAITVIPTSTTPRMLCLQYYRAKSHVWKDNGRCDDLKWKISSLFFHLPIVVKRTPALVMSSHDNLPL
jgi:hypothetical protein